MTIEIPDLNEGEVYHAKTIYFDDTDTIGIFDDKQRLLRALEFVDDSKSLEIDVVKINHSDYVKDSPLYVRMSVYFDDNGKIYHHSSKYYFVSEKEYACRKPGLLFEYVTNRSFKAFASVKDIAHAKRIAQQLAEICNEKIVTSGEFLHNSMHHYYWTPENWKYID